MGFNPTKTKVQLKLALNRLSLLQQKKTVQNQNMRREIGQLLKQSKYESARVRVEHIIREDFLVEALELLHLYVDMLLARFGLTTLQY
jgi:vacuolar protein sorting-associated protein IST1